MSGEVIGALIGLAGVLFGLVFTYIINLLSIKEQNKRDIEKENVEKYTFEKQLSINFITDKRIEWIQNLRQAVSEYVSVCMTITNDKNNVTPENIREINLKSGYIHLLLNFSDIIDSILIELMDKINKELENKRDIDNLITLFIKHSQIYLKLEWERVKAEVAGKEFNNSELAIELYDKMAHVRRIDKIEIKEVLDFIKLNKDNIE